MQMRAPGEGSAGCACKTCASEETCSLTDGRGRMAREQRCLWRCTGGVPARLSQRVLSACRRRARDSASLKCINLLSVEYNESMYRSSGTYAARTRGARRRVGVLQPPNHA